MKITIGHKVTIACATLVAATLLVGAVSLNSFFDLKGKLHTMVDRVLPGVYAMSAVRTTTKDMREYMLLHVTAADAKERGVLEAAIQKFDAKIRTEMKNYEARMDAPADRAIWARVVASYDAVQNVWENRIRPLGRAGNQAEALAVYRAELIPAREKLAKALDEGVAYNRSASTAGAERAKASADKGHLPIASIMCSSALAGLILTLFIVRGVNHTLRGAIADLEQAAKTIRQSAAQVARAGQSIAGGAFQQVQSLSVTYGACDIIGAEMEMSASGVRDSAELMTELVERLRDQTGEGLSGKRGELAAQIGASLERVRESSEDQATAMNSVTSSLREIEQVTTTAATEAGLSAAASQRMHGEAMSLAGVVERLRSLVDSAPAAGGGTPAGPGPADILQLSRAVSSSVEAEPETVAAGDRR